MRNLTDQELMRLIGRKRDPALAELYDRYGSLVYAFAWRALQEEQAARDIVQSVFLRLWTTEAVYDPDKGRFTSWLLTITRNITTDYVRRVRRERSGLTQAPPERLEGIPDSNADSPEENAVRQSERDRLRGAFRHLSEQQASLLEHFYWQGYSLTELADLYGQPLGTVKNRLHQALKILRRHLTPEGDNPA